jgi:hypothetical protein
MLLNKDKPIFPRGKQPGITKGEMLKMFFFAMNQGRLNKSQLNTAVENYFNIDEPEPFAKGLNHITAERREHFTKHHLTVSGDHKEYVGPRENELVNVAIYCLTLEDQFYPATWSPEYKAKILKKESIIDRLAVAGALIAAEIDRRLYEPITTT